MFYVFVSLVDFLIIDPTKPLVHYFGSTSLLPDPHQATHPAGYLVSVLAKKGMWLAGRGASDNGNP